MNKNRRIEILCFIAFGILLFWGIYNWFRIGDFYNIIFIVSYLSLSTIALLKTGNTIFYHSNTDYLYEQTWTSAGILYVLGGNNCVWINVTSDRVEIGLHFPFNIFCGIFFRPVSIPVKSICTIKDSFFGHIIQYRKNDKIVTFRVVLKDKISFFEAICYEENA